MTFEEWWDKNDKKFTIAATHSTYDVAKNFSKAAWYAAIVSASTPDKCSHPENECCKCYKCCQCCKCDKCPYSKCVNKL